MKITKIYLGVCSLLFACFLVFGVISNSLVLYASPYDLMIGTGSNALMTMELDDSDYAVMPMSSVGTVVNTISDDVEVAIVYFDSSGVSHTKYIYPEIENGRFDFYTSIPDGYIASVSFGLLKGSLPYPGGYIMSFDFASDFSVDAYSSAWFRYFKKYYNANSLYEDVRLNSFSQSSGDIYIPPVEIDLTSISWGQFRFYVQNAQAQGLKNFGGSFAVNFTKSVVGDGAISTGDQMSNSDYQSDVSSSLSDLSSSVDTMTGEISGVTEAIQNLQGAMEPHYSNVLTQLHHITEQLHAFYDQVYNNIHLPELDMLTQIRTAIENIDLQIEVDISEVKTAINNMSTAVQNKLQSTTDQITGGFDNSQQTQQNQQLHDSINAYDEVEEDIFEDVDGFMQEFEYPSFDSMNGSVIKALAFIGGFLQSIFLCMGDFGTIITFSLTMIFVMIIVGYHRIRS